MCRNMYVHACMYVGLQGVEEGIRSSGPRVTDDYEPICRGWEQNLSSLKEQV